MQNSSKIINQKYYVNDSYFNEINTEEKAYWLGFLWADGNISKTTKRSSGPNRLNISQKLSEIEHIKLFKKHINSQHKIKTYKHKNTCELEINSRNLCMSLESYGFNTKNKRIHIPDIPSNLIRDFIRGYFDGDGCLSIYQQPHKNYYVNRQEFSITGNKILLLEIRKILEEKANITKNLKVKNYKKSPNTISIRYGKQSDIEKLYDYLYENSSIYLKTKHNKFLKYYSRKNQ